MLVAGVCVSCSKEAAEDPEAPAALEARIGGVSLITRGGAADVNVLSTLGIFAVNKVAGETNYGVAPAGFYGKYTLTAGVAAPADVSQTVWLQLQKATIYSFYPAATPLAEGTADAPDPKITVPASAITLAPVIAASTKADQLDFALAENDYMYGVAYQSSAATEADKFLSVQPVADNGHTADGSVINQSGRQVAIGLKHAFAQVKLFIQKGDDYKGTAKLTGVQYKRNMPTLSATTKMSLKDGSLSGLSAAADVVYKYDLSGLTTPLYASTDIAITNYVVPSAVAKSTLTVEVDGKAMVLENNSEVAWKPGFIYVYTICIHPTGLELAGFNVVSWDTSKQSVGDIEI